VRVGGPEGVGANEVNADQLPDEIYNGTIEPKLIASANLRNAVLKELRVFGDLLCAFYDDDYEEYEKERIKAKIIQHLNPSSSFTVFKRWIIRDNQMLSAEFAGFH
jgi:hypothetical protein